MKENRFATVLIVGWDGKIFFWKRDELFGLPIIEVLKGEHPHISVGRLMMGLSACIPSLDKPTFWVSVEVASNKAYIGEVRFECYVLRRPTCFAGDYDTLGGTPCRLLGKEEALSQEGLCDYTRDCLLSLPLHPTAYITPPGIRQ